ncbi:MAG TPA: hypothetical protein DCZ10_01355 [Pelotomaculum sp.]|mgnify:CR=1 FL=1|nr:hypothetical protein [Pelotomaculum sp.]
MFKESSIMNFFCRERFGMKHKIEKFLDWACENAAMFDSLDGMNADIEKLSVLDDLLADKRVVYLGEEDHWIHEKNEYRILMLRYLFSQGWRYVGEELGWSDGVRIDHYLETGDLSYLDRIATYGYRGDVRDDRGDKPLGILKDSSDNYPVKEFKAEQIRLAKALRNFNENCLTESKRIHFFGFDVNAAAGGGYKDVQELLSPVQNLFELAELQKLLAIVPYETIEQEINRLSHVLDIINAKMIVLKEILGEKRYAQLQQWILTMRDSFDYFRLANPATDYKALNKAMAAREELMYCHVKFMLSQMGPKDKLVLMGHNRHLSKDIGKIKNLGASPPGGKLVPSLGTLINRLLPGQVFSIWMLHDHGKSSQPFTWLSNEYTSKPGSLNAILAEVGSTYLLPTVTSDARACLLKSEMDVVGLYNTTFRTSISKQTDAIFFTREVNPLLS